MPIVLGPNDKPILADHLNLGFNLSHSGDLGLLAVGRAREFGVDIEQKHLPADARNLARSVFSTSEMSTLDGIGDSDLSTPFFTCWTRKEAVLKAIGTGFIADPRSVTVGFEPMRTRIRVDARNHDELVDVERISHDSGAIASLAVVGGFSKFRFIDYLPEDQGEACP